MKVTPESPFVQENRQKLRDALRAYFLDELELEVGDLQLDLFTQFLDKEIGKYYYNLGIIDSIKAIKDKTEDLLLLVKD